MKSLLDLGEHKTKGNLCTINTQQMGKIEVEKKNINV